MSKKTLVNAHETNAIKIAGKYEKAIGQLIVNLAQIRASVSGIKMRKGFIVFLCSGR
jgi:hypothetical protein